MLCRFLDSLAILVCVTTLLFGRNAAKASCPVPGEYHLTDNTSCSKWQSLPFWITPPFPFSITEILYDGFPDGDVLRYEGQDVCLCIVASSPCLSSALRLNGVQHSNYETLNRYRTSDKNLLVSCLPINNFENGTRIQIIVLGPPGSNEDPRSSITAVVVIGNPSW